MWNKELDCEAAERQAAPGKIKSLFLPQVREKKVESWMIAAMCRIGKENKLTTDDLWGLIP